MMYDPNDAPVSILRTFILQLAPCGHNTHVRTHPPIQHIALFPGLPRFLFFGLRAYVLYSLVPSPPLFFALFRFRVLYWTKSKNKKTGEAWERGYTTHMHTLTFPSNDSLHQHPLGTAAISWSPPAFEFAPQTADEDEHTCRESTSHVHILLILW